ncbi:putative signal peptide protein [Puccinia sorghi]|uniref:Putative signal peptide protein n=1 Tax=Puccinia sorghi TaxID=27349 RepID=A0A0L6V2S1_9BASI|nr:putative signal peptide protein [Puccinia sorghi]
MKSFLSTPESKYRKALSSRSINLHWLIVLLSIANVTLAAPPQANTLKSLDIPPPPPDKLSVPVDLDNRPRIPRVEIETDKESSSVTHEKLATLDSDWKSDKEIKEGLEELRRLWQSKVKRTKVHQDFQYLEQRWRETKILGRTHDETGDKEKWINLIEEQFPKIQSLLLKINYQARGEPFPSKLIAQLFRETNDRGPWEGFMEKKLRLKFQG